ncbi:MAG: hypothetical protein D9V44_01005 [Actinobacteria bacterium]|nr:MAG: hypothetical protein D9V44_01005 [Actinomycetota bacterium]
MTKASRRIAVPLLALIAMALIVVSVVTSSTAVCGACHSMKPYIRALDASPHAAVSCYSCHLQAGAWDYPAFKLAEFGRMYPRAGETTLTRPTSLLSAAACLRCHADVGKGTAENNGLRIRHETCAVDGTCDGCHAAAAHGDAVRWKRSPSMEACVACHLDVQAPAACDSCHTLRTTADRLKKAPWATTHATGWSDAHGLDEIRYCRTCHQTEFCVRCHKIALPHGDDFPGRHGVDARKADSTCLTCHDRAAFCDACHQIEMPHPAGFLAEHGTAARGPADARCLACHRQADCSRCHDEHAGASASTSGAPEPGGE